MLLFAEKCQPVEFYDFLQVNTESNGSEVIDNNNSSARKDDDEVNQKEDMEQQSKAGHVSFIDFLSVGTS